MGRGNERASERGSESEGGNLSMPSDVSMPANIIMNAIGSMGLGQCVWAVSSSCRPSSIFSFATPRACPGSLGMWCFSTPLTLMQKVDYLNGYKLMISILTA